MRSGQSRNRHGWVLNSDGAIPAADTTCRVADSDKPNAVLMTLKPLSVFCRPASVEFGMSHVVAPLTGRNPVRGAGKRRTRGRTLPTGGSVAYGGVPPGSFETIPMARCGLLPVARPPTVKNTNA